MRRILLLVVALALACSLRGQILGPILFSPTPSGGGGGSYGAFKTITVDHTKVPSTQTNFPILISGTYTYLKTVSNGGSVQNSSGFDIAFGTNNTCSSLLSWEQETWGASTGTVNYWVNIPSLSSTVDTVIYLCYGNSGVSSFQGGATGAAWSTHYKMVQHLPDGTTLSANDSTVNGNTGTLTNSPTAGTGQIDGAGNFVAASSQYAGGASLALTTMTVSAWIKPATNTGTSQDWFSIGSVSGTDTALVMREESDTSLHIALFFDDLAVSGLTSMANTWTHVVYTQAASKVQTLYVNGVNVASRTAGGVYSGNTNWNIGRSFVGGVSSEFFDGLIDEVEVYDDAWTADWVTTVFNNQNSPGTFYSIT